MLGPAPIGGRPDPDPRSRRSTAAALEPVGRRPEGGHEGNRQGDAREDGGRATQLEGLRNHRHPPAIAPTTPAGVPMAPRRGCLPQ